MSLYFSVLQFRMSLYKTLFPSRIIIVPFSNQCIPFLLLFKTHAEKHRPYSFYIWKCAQIWVLLRVRSQQHFSNGGLIANFPAIS